VHGELIKAGKVEKLTYRQLERLEHIDARKAKSMLRLQRRLEREKTIEQAFIGAGTVTIYGLSEIAKETVKGVFSLGSSIAGNPDPISQAISIAGGGIALAWFVNAFPNVATTLHLDGLRFGTNAGFPSNKNTAAPNSPGPGGSFSITLRYVGPYGPYEFTQSYATRADAEASIDYYVNHTAGNFIFISKNYT
jgi:hypothetical protein